MILKLRRVFVEVKKCCLTQNTIALMGTASFCDEVRRAKDIVDSRFPAPQDLKLEICDLKFNM
ncbi:hypothetical protein ASG31_11040 [Chryseobacterium sp. Leaf404]|nr:hypothetical protein ASG31_11040 [Chryseobacterium sp. Leaf404]